MLKIGVLISGNGSNLQALIDEVKAGRLPAEIALVLSDNPEAYGLKRAAAAAIPARFLPPGPKRTVLSPEAEAAYADAFKQAGVELVCLAGFMRVIKAGLLAAFPGRILNIHPSLLPSFPGLAAWKQALDYGVRYTGCTVHLVEAGVDTGPIILQAVVPVEANDTPETLLNRIHREEHRIYPEAVRLFAESRVRLDGRRAVVTD
ncbi:MAG TPA: phosphoribosylglycinamide formyltransferase [bacterium]|uniref:Phosphoribosylglycinamide formyltransferase n=1 Tax=candidate division TA06 bacterium ADurb.Bin417 TaxID=1852828 RepID=A0A1V5MKG4_UNCT6|nr:MAG: Phosphoribosylglycinamide formyltransferase [candidate division TA06 bacterium ADurb.Bin417]HNQ35599.1 phosphoribosylglycinamide formyltransferase [bacterium]HNS48107.1 phosphoribosylglycinamide formyltransferase [bacterium]